MRISSKEKPCTPRNCSRINTKAEKRPCGKCSFLRICEQPFHPLICNMITTQDRFRGCLVGLAVGDAVGTTLEFRKPGTFEPISDMVGGGPFGLRPGYWTDDTSMALCLADSLITHNSMNHRDQMGRYAPPRCRRCGRSLSALPVADA